MFFNSGTNKKCLEVTLLSYWEKNKHVLIWLVRAVHFVQTIEFVMAPYGVGVPSMC